MKFFVSYSRSVQDSVRQIIASLRDDGEEVWWDQDLRSGQDWWATILDHIESSEVCLFMISEKAVQSPYCLEELRYGLARNRLILPFVLDGPVSYTIPPEIMKGRIQYELYSGRPAHLKDRIRITCNAADWTQYKDRFAVRPPEPNTGSSNLADRLAKAIALAQEGVFESAVEGFTDVAHNDHATFGDFCHTWIEKINRYKEIVSLSSHMAMKRLVLPKWAAFLKQYAEDDPFDPLGVEEKLAIKKVTATGPESSPDELQKVYDLIEEARKAHIENVPFGADPALYALGDMGEVAVIPILALLQDESPLMRESAVNLLGNIGDDRAIEPLIEMLQDSVWDVRWAACHMLPRFEDVRAIEPLIGMLKDPQAEVRDMAASALVVFEDPRAVEPLIALLQDENEKVRASAGRALKDLGYVAPSAEEQRVRDLLEQIRNTDAQDWDAYELLTEEIIKVGSPAVMFLIAALHDSNETVRSHVALALGSLGDLRAFEPLLTALHGNDGAVKCDVANALGTLGDLKAYEPLLAALQDKDGDLRVRGSAAEALGQLGDLRALMPLIGALQDSHDWAKYNAASALGELGDIRAFEPLLAAFQGNSFVRSAAAKALGQLDSVRALESLIMALQSGQEDSNRDVRSAAAEALSEIGNPQAIEPLIKALQDSDSFVRSAAAKALGELGDKRAIPALTKALKDRSVVRSAEKALEKIRAANPDA